MKFRTIPGTSSRVSEIGFSLTYDLLRDGEVRQLPNVIHLLRYALDRGINFFTSEAAAAINAELILGAALAGERDRVVFATKFVEKKEGVALAARLDAKMLAKQISESCDQSLRRLRTDYIDLFQISANCAAFDSPEIPAVIEKLRKQGKILAYGFYLDANTPELPLKPFSARAACLERPAGSNCHSNGRALLVSMTASAPLDPVLLAKYWLADKHVVSVFPKLGSEAEVNHISGVSESTALSADEREEIQNFYHEGSKGEVKK